MLRDDFRSQAIAAVVIIAAALMSWPKAQAFEAKTSQAVLTETVTLKTAKKEKKKDAPVKQVVPDTTWRPRSFNRVAELKELFSPVKMVIAKAREQLGKPYRYGAMGPSSFDCSGFTAFVWAAAGVHLPHSSRGQYSSLPHVAREDMRPGDIVYSPGHVGLYIGDGKMIHSPQTGEHVEIAPLHSNFVGAARPGL